MKKVIIFTREVLTRTQWRNFRYKEEIQAVAVIGGKKNPKIIGSTSDARHAFESDKTLIPFDKAIETRSEAKLKGYLADLSKGWGENAEELKSFAQRTLEEVKK